MPYIKEKKRRNFKFGLQNLSPKDAGELNFVLTEVCNRFLKAKQPLSYQDLNDVLGALEGAKQELYRRVVSPYEDAKRDENGEVY